MSRKVCNIHFNNILIGNPHSKMLVKNNIITFPNELDKKHWDIYIKDDSECFACKYMKGFRHGKLKKS